MKCSELVLIHPKQNSDRYRSEMKKQKDKNPTVIILNIVYNKKKLQPRCVISRR